MLIESVNEEWGHGSLNGCSGMFPLSFVELVEESPVKDPTPESPGMEFCFLFDADLTVLIDSLTLIRQLVRRHFQSVEYIFVSKQ